ncbi:MAG: HAMP domain-containing histidine kinase, partial [Rhodoferax sp.]|nr:HAMP domain-containing histidine kinase [Rhodoferax sp.]
FSQVLDNLIKNALHSLQTASSAFSEGDLQIEVGASGTKGRIVVIDKGMGINPKSLPHIFEAFFSTNRGTGHGLGLAFCKRVVETARGRLSVKSVPLQGATFIIELPVQVQVSNTHQGDTNS